MIYIIEHLDDEVYEWSLIEYKHISETVGKENLWFTNVKDGAMLLRPYGTVHKESVSTMHLHKVCVLDPAAEKVLSPMDARVFDYVVFGGILGDDPPRGRTKVLNAIKDASFRNLGAEQMSTNTAVLVTKRILDGTSFDKLKFQDTVIIPTGDGEEVELPYRYLIENGAPVIPKALIEKLKTDQDF